MDLLRHRPWVRMLLLALLYYAAARLGLLLAFADSNASPVWPPSGIALGALLIGGRRLWPGVFLGALVANLVVFVSNDVAHGMPALLISAAIAAGNTGEALLAAWLFRREVGKRDPLSSLQNVYRFAIIAAGACALAAAVGTGALLAGAVVPPALAWTVFGTWWVGDLVGVLVLAPLVLAWRTRATAMASMESLASLVLLALVLFAIFGRPFQPDSGERWIAYLIVPAIGWAAFRYGMRGATLVSALIAAASVAGTTNGLGPFATGTLNDALFAIQTFVALCCLVGMVLCADLDETRQRHADGPLRLRSMAHWGILFVCLAITVFVWHLVSSATEQSARERFNETVASIEERIGERMRTYEQGLLSANALFSASDSVEREEWRLFVDGMAVSKNFPGLQGIGFAQAVKGSELSLLEQKIRAEGFPRFTVRPAPAGERAMPIIFLEPFTAVNQRAFGYDLMSEQNRRDAILRAEASGNTAVTSRVTLLQESGAVPQAGFLMFVPAYRTGSALSTPEQRRAALLGMVYSPFRMNDLMAGILGSSVGDVELQIFDGASAAPAALMYSSTTRSAEERRDYPNPFTATSAIGLQQHQWTIRVTSLAAFENATDRQKAQIVLVAGTIISLLFFAGIRSLAAREEFAAARAEQMTSALVRSERKFESLVDSAVDFSIVATDLNGIITVFSQGAERMLGYAQQEVVGLHTPAILHLPQEVEARAAEIEKETGIAVSGFEVFVAAARRGQPEQREWTYVRRDGSHVPVSLVVTAIGDSDGQAAGFLGVAHNVSKQRDLQASLVRARDMAEAASRAKSDFVANMSHEIRTPMNAVLGIAHLLGKTALVPEQRKYLDMIRASGHSLLGIINDVLDFSKVEAGRMELAPEPFDLNDVMNLCASMMAVNAGDKPLELVVSIAPGLPERLEGDVLRLQQILTNLTSNAIKFTEQGAVALFAEQAGRAGDTVHVRFVVRDTGIGIDAAQQARLFSPFTQADASMARRYGGTGLGLTISKSLVQLMGGAIALDSVRGQGSSFSVTLPFRVLDEAGDAAPRAPRRLLLVSSDPLCQRALSEAAQALGWPAELVASGAAALARLQACAPAASHDVMVIDAALADMRGLALVQASQAGGTPLLPCVLLAPPGQQQPSDDMAQFTGKATRLSKPFTRDGLADAVASLLAPAQGSTPPPPASGGRGGADRLAGLRLLLVEDNELNQIVARGILEAEGVLVEVAGNGQEALDVLASDADFGLILMDVQMPVLDGLAATRRLRAELGIATPVIAMSAGVLASERAQCLAAGMNDFVAKPVDTAVLLAALRRHAPRQAPCATPDGMVPGVFDVQALLALKDRHPDGAAHLARLVERVLDKVPQQLDSVCNAYAAGLMAETGRALHDLRGSIGIVGASACRTRALQIETLLRDAPGDAALPGLLAELESDLRDIDQSARAWLATLTPA